MKSKRTAVAPNIKFPFPAPGRPTRASRALAVADRKRIAENLRHQKRLAEIDKEYWDTFYGRRK